jgi:hypothetical protein
MRLAPVSVRAFFHRGLAAALVAATWGLAPLPSLAQQPAAASLPASTRLALPGERHRWLEPLVGRWNVEMRVYVGPGQPPLVGKELRARRDWVLGGRYLREELEGVFAGNPSNRVATLGFNNLDERWELATVDTFEPGQMWYASQAIGTPTRFALHGESTEAGMGPQPTGRKRELRFEFEIVGPDQNVQRIYVKYPAQPEQLFVEQIFTRAR